MELFWNNSNTVYDFATFCSAESSQINFPWMVQVNKDRSTKVLQPSFFRLSYTFFLW